MTLASSLRMAPVQASGRARIKAIAFDAFPIFDMRPIQALAETCFPGHGTSLGNMWRSRQFEYQWLRALCGNYADFWKTTEDSLVFACAALGLELSSEVRKQLMGAFLALKAWPDVPAVLDTLKQAGIRLALLSNMTNNMLASNIKSAGLNGVFDHVLSSDSIRRYKPDPRVYQLSMETMQLKREEILFAAFAGWDAAGAKTFGYPTFWVNRLQAPREELGVDADATGKDLGELLSFVRQR